MNNNFFNNIGVPSINRDDIVETPAGTDPAQFGNTSTVQSGMADMNTLVQQALRNYSAGIQQQRTAQMQQLGTIESGMFDQMGRMQLQSERDIANRRMQALRSGMPSSQLAALELQNVQTAQLGAQQMAQQYDELRMQLGTELAGAEQMMEGDLMREMMQGRVDFEAIDAQRFASDIGAQMREVIPNWDELSNLERLQAIQAMNNPELLGSESDFINTMESNRTPFSTGGNVLTNESGEPVLDDEGNPILKWNPGAVQTEEQKTFIRDEFLTRGDNQTFASVGGFTDDRLWSVSELNSKDLGIGFRSGEQDSAQERYINTVKERALDGTIKAGDIINLNYGAGIEEWYLYTGNGFIDIRLQRTRSPFKTIEERGNTVWDNDGIGNRTTKLP